MRALFLAPHTDDAEFGAGGTIAKLVREGHDVWVQAFSLCDNPALKLEYEASMALLGVHAALIKDFPVRHFHEHRQAILEELMRLRSMFHFEVVYCPNTHDVHQDHQVIAAEALRAFKHSTILGYELPWNSYRFESTAYQVLSEADVRAKVNAAACYASQAHRPYANEAFIRSLATVRGTAIRAPYAEAFQSIRHIMP